MLSGLVSVGILNFQLVELVVCVGLYVSGEDGGLLDIPKSQPEIQFRLIYSRTFSR